jgi:hypothetical protein
MTDKAVWSKAVLNLRKAERRQATRRAPETTEPHFLVLLAVALICSVAVGAAMVAAWTL